MDRLWACGKARPSGDKGVGWDRRKRFIVGAKNEAEREVVRSPGKSIPWATSSLGVA